MTETKRATHRVEIEGVVRELPLFEVAPQLRIAVFNLLGDTEVVEAAAVGLARRLSEVDADVLVTAETKSVPLVYELARRMSKPWVILRKQYKPYMGETVTAETVSITTGHPQTLHLDEKDRPLIEGKKAILVDDVISTGSTLDGMRAVVRNAGGRIAAEAAVFTEGDTREVEGIVALDHLPLFPD
ncbi:MAG TPA: phosphoribosyltransferase family protein [Gaiella sp.]|nr:phosphoribosyltransferase family protein [Gaiella sp.]